MLLFPYLFLFLSPGIIRRPAVIYSCYFLWPITKADVSLVLLFSVSKWLRYVVPNVRWQRMEDTEWVNRRALLSLDSAFALR
jgi:hypothetical protein